MSSKMMTIANKKIKMDLQMVKLIVLTKISM